jgi:hypothetical protein
MRERCRHGAAYHGGGKYFGNTAALSFPSKHVLHDARGMMPFHRAGSEVTA